MPVLARRVCRGVHGHQLETCLLKWEMKRLAVAFRLLCIEQTIGSGIGEHMEARVVCGKEVKLEAEQKVRFEEENALAA